MFRWAAGVLLAGLLLGGSAAAGQESRGVGTHEGQYYPNYIFPTLDSDELTTIASFRGTKVLLVQFASW